MTALDVGGMPVDECAGLLQDGNAESTTKAAN